MSIEGPEVAQLHSLRFQRDKGENLVSMCMRCMDVVKREVDLEKSHGGEDRTMQQLAA